MFLTNVFTFAHIDRTRMNVTNQVSEI